jgi:hypothetical protein
MSTLNLALVSLLAVGVATPVRLAGGAGPDSVFEEKIAPLLKARCVKCHGPAVTKGGLNLALATGVARGGESGAAVVAGEPEESLLWRRVAADEMPEDEPLSHEEKETLREWIAGGAAGLPAEFPDKPDGDEHWAFQKLHQTASPEVADLAKVRTAVDRFLQRRLEDAGSSLSAEADRHTLVRRVALDVTGLPPTLAEIEAFVNDESDSAYEQMVERYLASPRYGERWGKYWLDAAGYADSNGYFNADTDRPLAYRYRDYVVRSLNADKPWDQFVREQLAGDELCGYQPGRELTPAMGELLEATHFLRNAPDGTDSSDGNADELRADKYAVLEGTIQVIGSSLLGMTVQCAKCHDHKFEPFSQRDYYSLQAVIFPAFNVEKWVKPAERTVVAATPAELAAHEAAKARIDERIAARRAELRKWLEEHRERGEVLFEDKFDGAGEGLAKLWTNTVPGDGAAAGKPAVNVGSKMAPGAVIEEGGLHVVESNEPGDRAICTQQAFDWTPEERGAWIQVTFDLAERSEAAPYVGYLLALRDFNDVQSSQGGNVLIDGAAAGKAGVYVDYPGADSAKRGEIGTSGYRPGGNYGVRITNRGDGKFQVAQVVDGFPEEGEMTLESGDLPDGAFGFEYCCGRSFTVDNVRMEVGKPLADSDAKRKELAAAALRKRKEIDAQVRKLEGEKSDAALRRAIVKDLSAEMPEVHLLARGDYKSPKERVEPAGPAVLGDSTHAARLVPAQEDAAGSTGCRLALARWLTDPTGRAAGLLARVTVNRVWQQHFGVGIVATPDNLGYSGAAPAHPELLEYLAGTFVENGWSAKAMHRLILNSAAYRQSSRFDESRRRADPDDRLLSRFPLKRLDAEAIRDSMLAASGELDLASGGPYVPTKRGDEGEIVVDESTPGAHRRGLYLQQRRTQVDGLLEVFDAPSIVSTCPRRDTTTVPLQSLKLLNSDFVRRRATALAKRIQDEAGEDSTARIQRAFFVVCGRAPTATELRESAAFLEQQATRYHAPNPSPALPWVDFCQALLSSNAFLYVN